VAPTKHPRVEREEGSARLLVRRQTVAVLRDLAVPTSVPRCERAEPALEHGVGEAAARLTRSGEQQRARQHDGARGNDPASEPRAVPCPGQHPYKNPRPRSVGGELYDSLSATPESWH
jgi:hypothetical protein